MLAPRPRLLPHRRRGGQGGHALRATWAELVVGIVCGGIGGIGVLLWSLWGLLAARGGPVAVAPVGALLWAGVAAAVGAFVAVPLGGRMPLSPGGGGSGAGMRGRGGSSSRSGAAAASSSSCCGPLTGLRALLGGAVAAALAWAVAAVASLVAAVRLEASVGVAAVSVLAVAAWGLAAAVAALRLGVVGGARSRQQHPPLVAVRGRGGGGYYDYDEGGGDYDDDDDDLHATTTSDGVLLNLRDDGGGDRSSPSRFSAGVRVAARCCAATGVVLVVLVGVLVAMGAVNEATGVVQYPPRGRFIRVKGADGRELELLVHCRGRTSSTPAPNSSASSFSAPPSTSSTTILLESDASHGQPDFWPLQSLLVDAGFRTCVYDKPGLGWSSPYYADTGVDPEGFYPQLIDAIAGKPDDRVLLVGWGGGGSIVYKYANRFPERVAGLVFLDVYGEDVEWLTAMYQHNWTSAETEAYRTQQLQGRVALFGAINAIACPFGLMGLAMPRNPAAYNGSDYDEYHWFYTASKTWTTQSVALNQMIVAGNDRLLASPFQITGFAEPSQGLAGMPLLQVMQVKTRETLCSKATFQPVSDDSKECDERVRVNAMTEANLRGVANVTGNPLLANCSDPACDLGFPLRLPSVAADAIITHFGHLRQER